MLQTCTNCPIADTFKTREKATLLTLLLDFIRNFKATPYRGQGDDPIPDWLG
jgi:hypothetical protein